MSRTRRPTRSSPLGYLRSGSAYYALSMALLPCLANAQAATADGQPGTATAPVEPPTMHTGEAATIPPTSDAGASASEPVAPPAQCFPHCRAGYLCSGGVCIQACNPTCPEGTQCSPELTCTPIGTRTSSELADGSNTEPERHARLEPTPEELAERERARAAARKRLRFQFGTRLSIIDAFENDRSGGEFGFLPGLRVNFTDHFGISFTADGYLGSWDSDDTTGSVAGVRAQLTPYFGPFRSITFGPTAVYGISSHVEEPQETLLDDAPKREFGMSKLGLGLRGALVRGAEEQLEFALQLLRFSEVEGSEFGGLNSNEFTFSVGYAF